MMDVRIPGSQCNYFERELIFQNTAQTEEHAYKTGAGEGKQHMETGNKATITVETVVNAPMERVWICWTDPLHIVKWNNASEDWHTPFAENDLRAGGKFLSRMEAKDGSAGFDFWGIYDEVRKEEYIAYTLGDERKVRITFERKGKDTKIIETFEAEGTFSQEMQKSGWQAILDNFRKYSELVWWIW